MPKRSTQASLKVAYFGTQAQANTEGKAVVSEFHKRYPNVNVEYTGTPAVDWNGFFEKVLSQIAAGNPPDIVDVATEGLQLFAEKKLATPLDSYVQRDRRQVQEYFSDVHPSLIEAMMYKGHLYSLPGNFNAANMFYNSALLDSAGLSRPSADWSKSDFESMASHYTRTKNASGWDFIVRLWGSWTPWMYVNGGNLYKESRYPGGDWMWKTFYANDSAAKGRAGGFRWGEPTADSPPVEEALQFMVDLHQQGVAPTPDIGGGSTLQGLFSSGHILATPGGGFWAGGLHSAGMKPDSFDVQFFPRWKNQRQLFGTAGYVIADSSSQRDLAWEYIKSYIGKPTMQLILQGNNTTPPRRSMMTQDRYSPTGPPHWQVFYDTLDKLDAVPIPASPTYDAMANAFNQRTTQAFSGGSSAKKALQALQQDLLQIQSQG